MRLKSVEERKLTSVVSAFLILEYGNSVLLRQQNLSLGCLRKHQSLPKRQVFASYLYHLSSFCGMLIACQEMTVAGISVSQGKHFFTQTFQEVVLKTPAGCVRRENSVYPTLLVCCVLY